MSLLTQGNGDRRRATDQQDPSPRGRRCSSGPKGRRDISSMFAAPVIGGKIRFTNVEQERQLESSRRITCIRGGSRREAAKLAYRLTANGTGRQSVAATRWSRLLLAAILPTNGRPWWQCRRSGGVGGRRGGPPVIVEGEGIAGGGGGGVKLWRGPGPRGQRSRARPGIRRAGGGAEAVGRRRISGVRARAESGLPMVQSDRCDPARPGICGWRGGAFTSWQNLDGGLDGIAIDLPAMNLKPTHGEYIPMNIQVKDPLWPMRDMLDFSFR